MPERACKVVPLFAQKDPKKSDQGRLVKLMDELAMMARTGDLKAVSFAAVVQRDELVCWSGNLGEAHGLDLDAVRGSGAQS